MAARACSCCSIAAMRLCSGRVFANALPREVERVVKRGACVRVRARACLCVRVCVCACVLSISLPPFHPLSLSPMSLFQFASQLPPLGFPPLPQLQTCESLGSLRPASQGAPGIRLFRVARASDGLSSPPPASPPTCSRGAAHRRWSPCPSCSAMDKGREKERKGRRRI